MDAAAARNMGIRGVRAASGDAHASCRVSCHLERARVCIAIEVSSSAQMRAGRLCWTAFAALTASFLIVWQVECATRVRDKRRAARVCSLPALFFLRSSSACSAFMRSVCSGARQHAAFSSHTRQVRDRHVASSAASLLRSRFLSPSSQCSATECC